MTQEMDMYSHTQRHRGTETQRKAHVNFSVPPCLRAAVFVILGALVLAAAAGAQTPAQPVTLDEVHHLVLAQYEPIQAAREQVQQTRMSRRQIGAALLPTVAVNTVVTRNFITETFNFGGRQIEVIPGNDYNIALVVSQPLFAGLRDLKARRQADLAIDIASRGVGTTSQDALLEATRAYYGVLAAQDTVEISKRALGVTEETLRTADSLYRAGETVETSVLRARVANSEARRTLLEAANGLELARQRLTLLAGVPTEFVAVRPPRPMAIDAPLDEIIALGLRTRPELKTLDLQKRIAELEVEKRRGAALPVVRADGTYIKRKSPFPSDQLSSFAVNATWTLFDGGRVAADVAVARAAQRELDERRELARKQTAQQIRTAYLTIQTLGASVDMLTAQVEFARKNAESTTRAYKVGEATDLDVLDANATLARSERQFSMTTYQLEVAMYELQRAVGTFAADKVDAAGDHE